MAGLERGGWAETERSLSRRVLVHPTTAAATKFWAVYREGATVRVQFGAYAGRDDFRFELGSWKDVHHPSPEAAAADYDRLLARKLAAGYVELWPRRNATRPTKPTPKRKPTPKAKPSTGRPKPVAAARRPARPKR